MPDIFVDKKEKVLPSSGVVGDGKGSVRSAFKSLSAFLEQPKWVTFETQASDEKIILLLRKHIITNVPWFLASTILFFIPFFTPLLAPIFNIETIPLRFQFIGLLLWYLFTFSIVFQNFLRWYYNVYIVTDHRVIDVDFFSLLYKEISDGPLERIQDVTYSMGGVASALFNYGNVFIQTAAEVPNFVFDAVPSPDRVVKTIAASMEERGMFLNKEAKK